MFDNILTFDHAVYITIGCAIELGAAWAIARVRALSKAPQQTLAQDAVSLVEKLVDSHLETHAAITAISNGTTNLATVTATTAPTPQAAG